MKNMKKISKKREKWEKRKNEKEIINNLSF
jgi:hypothetical protein